MKRAYYTAEVVDFLHQQENYILGELTKNNEFELTEQQRNAWREEIVIMKNVLYGFTEGTIVFEYTIPRVGKRIDVVLLYKGVSYLLEFKCGETGYFSYEKEQVLDYALDLKNFHQASHNIKLIPILVCTNAPEYHNNYEMYEDNIYHVILCNKHTLRTEIKTLSYDFEDIDFNHYDWINSIYMPTPTIIEAAQVMFRGHSVEDISRHDSSAINLAATSDAINQIIEHSKQNNRKSICFITGVPGAGKTLAGLKIANERHNFDENEHAVFLSGNGPLVDVLQEALARDKVAQCKELGTKLRKTDAMREAKAFIQIIHHFRDAALLSDDAPLEKVTIFDEAQRAWNQAQLTKFMNTKKGVSDFLMSEPEFLISYMDRHKDWATIVCLIGGGQEINVGEAGLSEWFNSIREKFNDWDVYVSDKITDLEYTGTQSLDEMLDGINYTINENLHLAVDLRSFRSEKVAQFVKELLDVNYNAENTFEILKEHYPIAVTRDLAKAKEWVKTKARGSERYGLIASSGAKRLKTDGIWVQSKCDAVTWFLNDKDDVRSSYYLEDTATEFDVQGLEVDWAILAWDADLRFNNGEFNYYNFNGTKWQNVNSDIAKTYLKNAYRVLLTRARQGFIIYVPKGDINDYTRQPSFYNGIYNYLVSLGIKEI